MSATNHQFSSCIVRVGPAGSTALTAANQVGVNQSVDLGVEYSRKELFDAAQNSIFAVDTADQMGKATLKLSHKDLAATLLAYTMGATSAAGTIGGNAATTYTVGALSKPAACRIEFDGITTAGKNIHFVATLAKFKGATLAAKIDDFTDNTLEADLYPDPGAAVAGSVFTYSIDN